MPRTKGSRNKNHKPKPHKEKKQRGRPKGTTKQHQKQNQSIKININNAGEKEYNKEQMLPVPNGIINTVLSNIPNSFPVNKPELNPPAFDVNSLMQPLINSLSQ